MNLLLEGDDLAALLLRAHREGGTAARIVRAEKIRRGGILGFFAREGFEVAVEIPKEDEPGEGSEADPEPISAPEPAPAPASAAATTVGPGTGPPGAGQPVLVPSGASQPVVVRTAGGLGAVAGLAAADGLLGLADRASAADGLLGLADRASAAERIAAQAIARRPVSPGQLPSTDITGRAPDTDSALAADNGRNLAADNGPTLAASSSTAIASATARAVGNAPIRVSDSGMNAPRPFTAIEFRQVQLPERTALASGARTDPVDDDPEVTAAIIAAAQQISAWHDEDRTLNRNLEESLEQQHPHERQNWGEESSAAAPVSGQEPSWDEEWDDEASAAAIWFDTRPTPTAGIAEPSPVAPRRPFVGLVEQLRGQANHVSELAIGPTRVLTHESVLRLKPGTIPKPAADQLPSNPAPSLEQSMSDGSRGTESDDALTDEPTAESPGSTTATLATPVASRTRIRHNGPTAVPLQRTPPNEAPAPDQAQAAEEMPTNPSTDSAAEAPTGSEVAPADTAPVLNYWRQGPRRRAANPAAPSHPATTQHHTWDTAPATAEQGQGEPDRDMTKIAKLTNRDSAIRADLLSPPEPAPATEHQADHLIARAQAAAAAERAQTEAAAEQARRTAETAQIRLEAEAAERARVEAEATEAARIKVAAERAQIEAEATAWARAEAEAADRARAEAEATARARAEAEVAQIRAAADAAAAEVARIRATAEAAAAETARAEAQAAEVVITVAPTRRALRISSRDQLATERASLRALGVPAAWTQHLVAGDRFESILTMLKQMPEPRLREDLAVIAVVGPPRVVEEEAQRIASDQRTGGRTRAVTVTAGSAGIDRRTAIARSRRTRPVVISVPVDGQHHFAATRAILAGLQAEAVVAVLDSGLPPAEAAAWLAEIGPVDAITLVGALTHPEPVALLGLALPVIGLDGRSLDREGWAAVLCAQLSTGERP